MKTLSNMKGQNENFELKQYKITPLNHSLNSPCRDTNLWRPNNGVGLARERSLTIILVESGLERPALDHRALFRVEQLGAQTGKNLGLDIQAL